MIQTPREVVEDWLRGIRIEIPSHYGAAKLFERYQSLIDWPTIIITSVTSTAIVSTLSQVDGGITVLKGVAILLSIAAVVLAALRSFMDYGTRAKLHKAAAVSLTRLEREVAETLAFEPELSRDQSAQFRTRWDDICEKSPTIPDSQYAKHKERMEAQEAAKPA